jgi:hypothetical protein
VKEDPGEGECWRGRVRARERAGLEGTGLEGVDLEGLGLMGVGHWSRGCHTGSAGQPSRIASAWSESFRYGRGITCPVWCRNHSEDTYLKFRQIS